MNGAVSFGKLMGCIEFGLPPESLARLEGSSVKMASDDGATGRFIAEAAHKIMRDCGYGTSAAACHLNLVAKSAHWTSHHQEVVDDVVRAAEAFAPHVKHAFSDALGALGLTARGIGYGSVAGGAGLGALYWLLSRHANQDEADMEAMQRQTDYYHNLSKELNHSMHRKYRYDDINQLEQNA